MNINIHTVILKLKTKVTFNHLIYNLNFWKNKIKNNQQQNSIPISIWDRHGLWNTIWPNVTNKIWNEMTKSIDL